MTRPLTQPMGNQMVCLYFIAPLEKEVLNSYRQLYVWYEDKDDLLLSLLVHVN